MRGRGIEDTKAPTRACGAKGAQGWSWTAALARTPAPPHGGRGQAEIYDATGRLRRGSLSPSPADIVDIPGLDDFKGHVMDLTSDTGFIGYDPQLGTLASTITMQLGA